MDREEDPRRRGTNSARVGEGLKISVFGPVPKNKERKGVRSLIRLWTRNVHTGKGEDKRCQELPFLYRLNRVVKSWVEERSLIVSRVIYNSLTLLVLQQWEDYVY